MLNYDDFSQYDVGSHYDVDYDEMDHVIMLIMLSYDHDVLVMMMKLWHGQDTHTMMMKVMDIYVIGMMSMLRLLQLVVAMYIGHPSVACSIGDSTMGGY